MYPNSRPNVARARFPYVQTVMYHPASQNPIMPQSPNMVEKQQLLIEEPADDISKQSLIQVPVNARPATTDISTQSLIQVQVKQNNNLVISDFDQLGVNLNDLCLLQSHFKRATGKYEKIDRNRFIMVYSNLHPNSTLNQNFSQFAYDIFSEIDVKRTGYFNFVEYLAAYGKLRKKMNH
jgi:hypothetical protein